MIIIEIQKQRFIRFFGILVDYNKVGKNSIVGLTLK